MTCNRTSHGGFGLFFSPAGRQSNSQTHTLLEVFDGIIPFFPTKIPCANSSFVNINTCWCCSLAHSCAERLVGMPFLKYVVADPIQPSCLTQVASSLGPFALLGLPVPALRQLGIVGGPGAVSPWDGCGGSAGAHLLQMGGLHKLSGRRKRGWRCRMFLWQVDVLAKSSGLRAW